MVQVFIGYKPNVGPVLKCLKYDGDNALTLANTAYDRYIYNSENSALSYAFTTTPFHLNNQSISDLPSSFNISTNGRIIITGNKGTYAQFYTVRYYYRITNAFPNMGYPPLVELRNKNEVNGRIACGHYYDDYSVANDGVHEVITIQQFDTIMCRFTSTTSSQTTLRHIYNGTINSSDASGLTNGEWCTYGFENVWRDNSNASAIFPSIWDLPADSSNMRSYNFTPGLLSLEADQTKFVLSRPGYSTNTTNEFGTIINSNGRSPALCIMNGTENAIPRNESRFIPAPPGVILSEKAVVDVMFRVAGDTWCVPSRMTETSGGGRWFVYYSVASNGITFYNTDKEVIDLRYAVFNIDDQPTSTGGNQVLFRGTQSGQDYIQIKKPGTSDPASRPNDILFDTRYPQFQIISQGYIPVSSFSASTPQESATKGALKYRQSFNNAGFVPFLKFSIVFPNCVTAPFHRRERSGGGVANISMLGEVHDNYVDFFCSPNSGWSFADVGDSGGWSRTDYGARIQGVRYYIFGISA